MASRAAVYGVLAIALVADARGGAGDFQRPAEAGVAGSAHRGGSLVVAGGRVYLPRVSYHLDVHIEDGFARTTIDQVFYNTTGVRQEGKYRFPLPEGASISRLAMYVNGHLIEAGMVERERAAAVYRDILHKQRDPVLLEWVDGRTFAMRVFPIEARDHKRIVISYTQRLAADGDKVFYHFPGADPKKAGRWSAEVRVRGGFGGDWSSEFHEFTARRSGGDLLLSCEMEDVSPVGDVALLFERRATRRQRFEVTEVGGARYALVRWRPELASLPEPERRDWVVVFEASADRDPVVARRQIDALRGLVETRGEGRLTVVVANTGTEVIERDHLARLERVHLIGALDLNRAFARVRELTRYRRPAVVVHLGGGVASLGERAAAELVKVLPDGVPYVGAGVGRQWNHELMKLAAERSGGVFGEVSSAADLVRLVRGVTVVRLDDIEVVGAGGIEFLSETRRLVDGGELVAVARLAEGQELPGVVTVRGRLAGGRWERELQAVWGKSEAGYLPRHWARLEIDRLMEAPQAGRRDAVVALSKSMGVMSPFTSLLVLESAQMHEEYGVARGTGSHWAKYPAPATMARLSAPKLKLQPEPAAVPRWGGEGMRRGGEEIEIEFPKPMFCGTPVSINRPNLERMGLRRPVGAVAWRPMFAGRQVKVSGTPHGYFRKPRLTLFAPRGTEIVSVGAKVTSSDMHPIFGDLDMAVDGNKDGADGNYFELGPGKQWLQIDLGGRRTLWGIVLWHFFKNVRAYDDIVVQLSDDPEFRAGVRTIFNNDFDNSSGFGSGSDPAWIETNHGRIIDVPGIAARYLRFYSNGNTANEMNHYVEVEVWGTKGSAGDFRAAAVVGGDWGAVANFEQRAELQWRKQGGVIDLAWLRQSHAAILAAMAEAARAGGDMPEDVISRAVRVADRWWGIDGASVRACQMAAVLMAELGRDDLKWAYLTTPVAVSHGDSGRWREVAVFARHESDPAMAELARREAVAARGR